MKFKLGDKVVYYPESGVSKLFQELIGKTFTIKSTSSSSLTNWYVQEEAGGFTPHEKNLIPEYIFHSPLAKALK